MSKLKVKDNNNNWHEIALTEELDAKSDKNVSFSVTLTVAGWSNNQQTVSNANFLTGDYDYIVSPAPSSFGDYTSAVIYADDIVTAEQMVFHCENVPTSAITVYVVRSEHA